MRTRIWFGALLVTISVSLLLGSPNATAGNGSGAYKLEGAWVAKVIGIPGQWSYVVVADPSGRRASGHGSVDVGFRSEAVGCFAFEPTDFASPILVNIVMTGPDTAAYYSIYYGLKNLDEGLLTTEIVYIGIVTGELKFVAPGKANGTHNFAFFAPTQDADGDGFPDEGQTPTCVSPPLYTVDTRLPAP